MGVCALSKPPRKNRADVDAGSWGGFPKGEHIVSNKPSSHNAQVSDTFDWTNGPTILHEADAREIPLPDASVHCVVTSPPYWGLRDYGLGQWQGGDAECGHKRLAKDRQKEHGLTDRLPGTAAYGGNAEEPWPDGVCGLCGAVQQAAGIGLEPTLGEWVEHIVAVMREVRRVLRDDGTVWLNLGDAYASIGRSPKKESPGVGATQAMPRVEREVTWQAGGGHNFNWELPGGIRPKNLMGQPWRVAFALQDDGWVLRSSIIWHKPNPMPESVTDRPTNAYENIFLFSKSNKSLYWSHRDHGGTRVVPEADYRWKDASNGTEYDQEPEDFSGATIVCPECEGAGEIVHEVGQVDMFDGAPTLVEPCLHCLVCGKCGDEAQHPGLVHRWSKVNLWRSHDYFYDAEAIRTPSTEHRGGRLSLYLMRRPKRILTHRS